MGGRKRIARDVYGIALRAGTEEVAALMRSGGPICVLLNEVERQRNDLRNTLWLVPSKSGT